MYFGMRQYPWVRALPKTERHAVLSAVVRATPFVAWRFWSSLALIIALTLLMGWYVDVRGLLRLFPVCAGVAFYLYLLWEINGPLYRAAQRHFAGADRDINKNGSSNGPRSGASHDA